MCAIQLIRPAPQLRKYIRLYLQLNVCVARGVFVHPVTARAVPLIDFNLADRFKVSYRDPSLEKRTPRASVVGPQTHCRSQLELQGTIDSFVIMFQPAGLHGLFSVSMSELTDRDYEARAVLGPTISELEQHLGDCRTLEERVRIADDFLIRRISDARDSNGISVAANEILARGGSSRIAALADDAGLSIRQFERRFVNQVGMRPKLYSRIARFEAALDRKARSAAKSWTDVAHELGYYDQMHMVHDFRYFTGETPGKTLNLVESLFAVQIAESRSGKPSAGFVNESRFIL